VVLDYSSLEKAKEQLVKTLELLRTDPRVRTTDLHDAVRAGAIQAFEFTYELAVKMIRRQLEQMVSFPDQVREMNFMDLVREAADAGLISDPIAFRTYREARNVTSHAYDADRADRVIAVLDGFCEDVDFLLRELRERNREGD
jgi:nucleotidyltransferase substrate binding protein (TIGR01987 family)